LDISDALLVLLTALRTVIGSLLLPTWCVLHQ
jgi:hypothetical protein